MEEVNECQLTEELKGQLLMLETGECVSRHAASFAVAGGITDFVKSKSIVEGRLLPEEQRIKLRDLALAAFDSFDIPYVGGFVESMIKSRIRPALLQALNSVLGLE